jgi:hypothetical protein
MINPSTSGLASLVSESKSRYFSEENNIEIVPRVSALSYSLADFEVDNYPNKILLIVLESYGLFKNEAIYNEIINEFSNKINKNYIIKLKSVKFSGATTSGEIRELCGVKADSYEIVSILKKHECLPSRLANLGYKTTGFHYFFKSSFNRDIWWPKVGFSNTYFLDSYNHRKKILCGGFLNGWCDKQLILDLFESLDDQSKSFSYGLTLNSHLPVHRNDDIIAIKKLKEKKYFDVTNDIELLIDSWRVVFNEVSEQLNKKNCNDVLIVIVGDHAPPYMAKQNRSVFSSAEVPYIVISPKK